MASEVFATLHWDFENVRMEVNLESSEISSATIEAFADRLFYEWKLRTAHEDRCELVSRIVNKEKNPEVVERFCSKIQVARTSPVFEMMVLIGDLQAVWDEAPEQDIWLFFAFLAITDEEELRLVKRLGHEAKSGNTALAMQSLMALRRRRYPDFGANWLGFGTEDR